MTETVTMFEYHATCGASKKIITCTSSLARDISQQLTKSFSISPGSSFVVQYWSAKYSDWVDAANDTQIATETKLNICFRGCEELLVSPSLNLLSTTLSRASTPSSPSIGYTTDTFSELGRELTKENFPYRYKLPEFPAVVQKLLDECNPESREAKCRKAIVNAIFDDLLQYTIYPTDRMYNESCRALVEAYPHLKDNMFNAEPHASWTLRVRDKFKKYRSRNGHLYETQAVQAMKEKFGRKRTPGSVAQSSTSDCEGLAPAKRARDLTVLEGEDDASIAQHMKVIASECDKESPDWVLLRDKMERTAVHRAEFIAKHNVKDVLDAFPPLKKEEQLLLEADRTAGIKPGMLHSFMLHKNQAILAYANQLKVKNPRVKQLYEAFAETTARAATDTSFPALMLCACLREELPFVYTTSVDTPITKVHPLIVYSATSNVFNNKEYSLYVDKHLVTTCSNIVNALTLWFAAYWIFDIKYEKGTSKFLSFLDTFVFQKTTVQKLPRSVQTFYNSISHVDSVDFASFTTMLSNTE